MESNISRINELLKEKDNEIELLRSRIKVLEEPTHVQDHKNISTLEKRIKEVEDTNYVLIHAVDDCEHGIRSLQATATLSRSNMSTTTSTSSFAYACDICGEALQNKSAWSDHLRIKHGT